MKRKFFLSTQRTATPGGSGGRVPGNVGLPRAQGTNQLHAVGQDDEPDLPHAAWLGVSSEPIFFFF